MNTLLPFGGLIKKKCNLFAIEMIYNHDETK